MRYRMKKVRAFHYSSVSLFRLSKKTNASTIFLKNRLLSYVRARARLSLFFLSSLYVRKSFNLIGYIFHSIVEEKVSYFVESGLVSRHLKK